MLAGRQSSPPGRRRPQVGARANCAGRYRDSGLGRAYLRPPLRLVTFDRRGHRRLGAILEGEVVDLPDAVGHPAFPATLERLVTSNGGTVLDAARAALERDDACGLPRRTATPPDAAVPRVPDLAERPRGRAPGRRARGRGPVARRRRLARVRADGRGRARPPRPRTPSARGDAGHRVRLHARERLARTPTNGAPMRARRRRPALDRPVRRDGRRARPADHVRPGAGSTATSGPRGT